MKIFIVGTEDIDKLNIANEMVAQNDDLNICKAFTSKTNKGNAYTYILDEEDIQLSWKNNVLLFLNYSYSNIYGITLDDFKSSDIIPIDTKYFNMIIDDVFSNNDILIVWIDNKNKHTQKELIEVKYLEERIESFNLPLLYFINESNEEISKIVLEYLLGDECVRNEILEENS